MGIFHNETKVWLVETPIKDHRKIYKRYIKEIFYKLAENDDDFNGSNNVEGESNYNWEETDNGGYSSNCDYLTEELLKDIEDDKELKYSEISDLIDKFLYEWTHNDTYYRGVAFDFRTTLDSLIVAVGVTTE